MIETGTVKSHNPKTGQITVRFEQFGTEVECDVLQATTGDNTTCILPSKGTQVVCWLEEGKNLALGALFSQAEPVPAEASDLYVKCGTFECLIAEDKIAIKNAATNLKTLLNDILSVVKNLTVSTPSGASGTPLPPTIAAVEQCTAKINNLFK